MSGFFVNFARVVFVCLISNVIVIVDLYLAIVFSLYFFGCQPPDLAVQARLLMILGGFLLPPLLCVMLAGYGNILMGVFRLTKWMLMWISDAASDPSKSPLSYFAALFAAVGCTAKILVAVGVVSAFPR